jgi:AraC-like DNA-binding protein
MARPTKEPASPSALVPALLRLVRQHDPGEARLLALRIGLSDADVEADEVPATESMIDAALEGAADALSEPHLSLRLPAALPLRRYGPAELAARSASTLRQAMGRLSQYASLVHPAVACTLEPLEGEVLWVQRTPSRPRGAGLHVQQYALAYVLTLARRDTGGDVTPLRAWFSHARPPDLAPVHRFFGTRELSFGCEDSGFALSAGTLELPIRTGDPRLLVTADDLARAALRAQPRITELAAGVAQRVEVLLPRGATMGAIADAMHMSARTLQRRLEAEGESFSEIVDGVRERLARRWLADPGRTISEVAYGLGFSDLAAFSRAFKRWTGKPPGAWRRS